MTQQTNKKQLTENRFYYSEFWTKPLGDVLIKIVKITDDKVYYKKVREIEIYKNHYKLHFDIVDLMPIDEIDLTFSNEHFKSVDFVKLSCLRHVKEKYKVKDNDDINAINKFILKYNIFHFGHVTLLCLENTIYFKNNLQFTLFRLFHDYNIILNNCKEYNQRGSYYENLLKAETKKKLETEHAAHKLLNDNIKMDFDIEHIIKLIEKSREDKHDVVFCYRFSTNKETILSQLLPPDYFINNKPAF